MKRIVFSLLCLVLILVFELPVQAGESARLKLYVGAVKGDQELLEPVRSQLVEELAKRGVALVPSEQEADATVMAAGVQRVGRHVMFRTRSTVLIAISGRVQVRGRDGRKLWAGDVRSAPWAVSETASFAENAAKRIAEVLRTASVGPDPSAGP